MSDAEKDVVAAALRVRDAIRNEGIAPHVHRQVLARHRNDWPHLWDRLDRLVAELDHLSHDEWSLR